MPKTITPFTAQLVTFETTLPVAEVIARLDVEVNKPGSVGTVIPLMKAPASKEVIEQGLQKISEGRDFVYVLQVVIVLLNIIQLHHLLGTSSSSHTTTG